MLLFHISHQDLGDEFLMEPRVPPLRATREDGQTPRVCFAPSLKGCLEAMYRSGVIHIYTPVQRPQKVVRPWYDGTTPSYDMNAYKGGKYLGYVSDGGDSEEVWVLEPVRVKRLRTVYLFRTFCNEKPKEWEHLPTIKMKDKKVRRNRSLWPDWIPWFKPEMVNAVPLPQEEIERRNLPAPSIGSGFTISMKTKEKLPDIDPDLQIPVVTQEEWKKGMEDLKKAISNAFAPKPLKVEVIAIDSLAGTPLKPVEEASLTKYWIPKQHGGKITMLGTFEGLIVKDENFHSDLTKLFDLSGLTWEQKKKAKREAKRARILAKEQMKRENQTFVVNKPKIKNPVLLESNQKHWQV